MKLGPFILFAVVLLGSPVMGADSPISSTTKPVTNQITISNYMFAPSLLQVAAGTKVTWINHDEAPHTVVDSAGEKTFRSGALDTDDSYSFTFKKPGTYHYFCTVHPQMLGTIIVSVPQ